MQESITRRQLLHDLGLIAASLAAAACTPLRVLVSAYPERFDEDEALVECVLRAFATTVIPGAPADDPDLTRALVDPAYPFAQYSGFFAADLSRRARERFRAPFEQLGAPERTAIVRDGLAADGVSQKIYSGAITLTQIAFYAGIYAPQKGCALIDFEGGYHLHARREITHADPTRFLARALTPDGNHT